ncbi:hypothetical protein [Streptococcus parauberis]|uniref:hypothetical protein n=1 Tax=Streptococcus parauberis TaxID=1348 RepID=UPI00378DECC6
MYSRLFQDKNEIVFLAKADELDSLFSDETHTSTMIGGYVKQVDIEDTFMTLSKSYFESSLLYVDFLIDNGDYADFEVLNVIHNVLIGIELSLKSFLSTIMQFNSDEWMIPASEIKNGHSYRSFIGQIRSSIAQAYEERLIESKDKQWLFKHIAIIEKFIQQTEEQDITFISSRYPINRDQKLYGYMSKDVNIDLLVLREWIFILFNSCSQISNIKYYLDDARDNYS